VQARLKERSQNRDTEATVTVLQAQLKALRRSIPILDTAQSSNSTRTSCPRRSNSLHGNG
jgi:hypothetical protein